MRIDFSFLRQDINMNVRTTAKLWNGLVPLLHCTAVLLYIVGSWLLVDVLGAWVGGTVGGI